MSSIVAIVLEALKSNDSIISAESQMMTELSQLVCAGVAQACEQLDDDLCLGHKDYRIIHKDQRHITAMFGDVVFKRRLVKDDSGRLFYPFDEKVGLATGRRFTPMIMATVAELASLTVMRTTAKAVDLLTPFSMSAMNVDNLVREAGQELDTVREAEAKYVTVEVDRRAVPQLFIEGDAFEVKLKHGTQVMVHRVQISEGVTQSGKRHQLINRHSITLQLMSKSATDRRLLTAAIARDRETDEFFIQKAIGWALRQYSKTDSAWVAAFIEQNQLSALATREAAKYLTKPSVSTCHLSLNSLY